MGARGTASAVKRVIYVYRKGRWKLVKFKELRWGDIFRVYEGPAPSKPYIDPQGNVLFRAHSDPCFKDGRWIIRIKN